MGIASKTLREYKPARYSRIRLGPVLPVLLKKDPTDEDKRKHRIKLAEAWKKHAAKEAKYLKDATVGIVPPLYKMTLLERAQRPILPPKIVPSLDTAPRKFTDVKPAKPLIPPPKPSPPQIGPLFPTKEQRASQPKKPIPKRLKKVTYVAFREPCWVIDSGHVRDVAKILDTMELYCDTLDKEIPMLFKDIHKRQYTGDSKNADLNCRWKYEGIRRFIDVINTAIHLMTTDRH